MGGCKAWIWLEFFPPKVKTCWNQIVQCPNPPKNLQKGRVHVPHSCGIFHYDEDIPKWKYIPTRHNSHDKPVVLFPNTPPSCYSRFIVLLCQKWRIFNRNKMDHNLKHRRRWRLVVTTQVIKFLMFLSGHPITFRLVSGWPPSWSSSHEWYWLVPPQNVPRHPKKEWGVGFWNLNSISANDDAESSRRSHWFTKIFTDISRQKKVSLPKVEVFFCMELSL